MPRLMITNLPPFAREELKEALGKDWRVEPYGVMLVGRKFDHIVVANPPLNTNANKWLLTLGTHLPPGRRVQRIY